LETLPVGQQSSIRQVYIDMHEGFSHAVQEALPAARIVVGRFHVAKHFRACADQA